MGDNLESAERWVAEVEAAYADGGYAASDGPSAPLDEMRWLLAERAQLRDVLVECRDWFELHSDRSAILDRITEVLGRAEGEPT